MVWAEREKNVLHFVLTYVGAGANANVEYIASQIPGSQLERSLHDGLSWAHGRVSPPGLALDGVQVVVHLEAYEGTRAAKRTRFANTDALCVLIAPASQMVPFLHHRVTRQAAEEAGLDWMKLPVVMQVHRDAPGGDSLAELKDMVGEPDRSWFEATPESTGVFDTFKALVKAALSAHRAGASRAATAMPLVVQPDVVKIRAGDPELAAAYEQARSTLDQFFAKLARPGASQAHAVQTQLREGDVVEHVWLSEVRRDGDQLVGTLDNVPVDVKGYEMGATIRIARAAVQDWMYMEGGKLRGAFTMRVQARRGNVAPEILALLEP
jgi:uncharacterized protein YegJ (DUF2314 family)